MYETEKICTSNEMNVTKTSMMPARLSSRIPAVKFTALIDSLRLNQFHWKCSGGPFQVWLNIPRAKRKLIPAVRIANQSPWRGNFLPMKNKTRNDTNGTSSKPSASCPARLSDICDMVAAEFRLIWFLVAGC